MTDAQIKIEIEAQDGKIKVKSSLGGARLTMRLDIDKHDPADLETLASAAPMILDRAADSIVEELEKMEASE